MNNLIVESSQVSLNSGAYSLLQTLLDRLESRNINTTVYLSSERVLFQLSSRNYTNISFVKTTFIKTFLRYFKRRSSVFYFMNIPPFCKNDNSILYFHNELILHDKSFGHRSLKYSLYRFFLVTFAKNIDTIACQTEHIHTLLQKLTRKRVAILPFFNETYRSENYSRKRYDFCYLASGAPHKNHHRLLQAIDVLSSNYFFTVLLTLPRTHSSESLLEKVSRINSKHGRTIIDNVGALSMEQVLEVYSMSRALVFPSLKESLGLPLIEAHLNGLVVLSSDLPYSHAILENPLVFDPMQVEEIVKKMAKFLKGEYSEVNQKILLENKIDIIINSIIYV